MSNDNASRSPRKNQLPQKSNLICQGGGGLPKTRSHAFFFSLSHEQEKREQRGIRHPRKYKSQLVGCSERIQLRTVSPILNFPPPPGIVSVFFLFSDGRSR